MSLGLAGILGVFINILIFNSFGTNALGVFNQIYAIYIVLSQIAVGGMQFSIQYFIPIVNEKSLKITILTSALIATTCFTVVIMILGYWLKEIPGKILSSEDVQAGFVYVIPGLLFFSYNKIIIAYLNGLRRMRVYAIAQLLRFVFMLASVFVLIYIEVPIYFIAGILSMAEFLLFIFLIIIILPDFFGTHFDSIKYWVLRHVKYGYKVLLGNVLMDVNTRVDVFLLGIFLPDGQVGIYSFAATVAEGVYQLPILFRNNLNPILTNCHQRNNKLLLERVMNKALKSFYKVLSTIALLTILGFPFLYFVGAVKEEFFSTWIIYAIMVGGVVLTSGYIPFQMVFNQIGLPFQQTLFYVFSFVSNVILNIILIPLLGVYGAAIATSLVMLLQVLYQKKLIRTNYKIRLGFRLSI